MIRNMTTRMDSALAMKPTPFNRDAGSPFADVPVESAVGADYSPRRKGASR